LLICSVVAAEISAIGFSSEGATAGVRLSASQAAPNAEDFSSTKTLAAGSTSANSR